MTCGYFSAFQGRAAAAVFRLHRITDRGPGGAADIPRGAVRLHLTERVRSLSLTLSTFNSSWQPFMHEHASQGSCQRDWGKFLVSSVHHNSASQLRPASKDAFCKARQIHALTTLNRCTLQSPSGDGEKIQTQWFQDTLLLEESNFQFQKSITGCYPSII